MNIEAIATVTYTCELSEEDEQKVLQYIKDNADDFNFMSAKQKIIKAIDELHGNCEIDLYDNSTESDFCTEEIKWSEFEDKKAEEYLKDIE